MTNLIIFLVLLVLGYGVGQFLETRHFRSIIERENIHKNIILISERHLPDSYQTPEYTNQLVSGSVVVSVDYFKRFVAGLRLLVGGRLATYETLLERGRREALLRLKEQASTLNADMVFNCKIETASISKGQNDSIGSVEVFVYGTAIIPAPATNTARG